MKYFVSRSFLLSLRIHDLNGDRSRQSHQWRHGGVQGLRSGNASVISTILKTCSRQQQTTCCALASLLILQIDAAPCEIRIYYRGIVIPWDGGRTKSYSDSRTVTNRENIVAKEGEWGENEMIQWLNREKKQFVLTLFIDLTTVLMMLGDSPSKWEKSCCLSQLEDLKDQRFLLSALFYGDGERQQEKSKQEKFFKVSKKVLQQLCLWYC